MIRTALGSVLAALLLAGSPARGQEADCVGGAAVDPVCEFRIRSHGPEASDVGVYNVFVRLERLVPAADTRPLTVAIDASACGRPLHRQVEEPVNFAGEETTLTFNFPLFLRGSDTAGEHCVRVAAVGCGDSCGGRVGLAVGNSAVMRQVRDPSLR